MVSGAKKTKKNWVLQRLQGSICGLTIFYIPKKKNLCTLLWSTPILPAANYYILWYLLWSTPILLAANYYILWYLLWSTPILPAANYYIPPQPKKLFRMLWHTSLLCFIFRLYFITSLFLSSSSPSTHQQNMFLSAQRIIILPWI